jgi:hypothetical protein
MRTHYNPHEIHYDRDSIIWILEHAQSDSWPRPASNYTDTAPDIQKQRNTVMPNRGWIETVSEVKRRLKMCGTDAPLVILNLVYNIPCGEIESLLKEHDVERRIWRAINYISWGHDITKARTKRGTYKEWCERSRKRAEKAANKRWNHAKCMLDV